MPIWGLINKPPIHVHWKITPYRRIFRHHNQCVRLQKQLGQNKNGVEKKLVGVFRSFFGAGNLPYIQCNLSKYIIYCNIFFFWLITTIQLPPSINVSIHGMNSSNLNAAFCKCIVFACDNAIGLQCIFAMHPITLLRLLHRHVPRA